MPRLPRPNARPGRSRPLARALTILFFFFALSPPLRAAEPTALPVDQQLPLLIKVLTYDRNLETKAGPRLSIGIVHEPGHRDSGTAAHELAGALAKYRNKTVKGLPLRHFTIEYKSVTELERTVIANRISALYLAPGTDAALEAILKLSRQLDLTTLTGTPAYVEKGVAVGVGASAGGPQILINLASARAEGCDFGASLLEIATIVGPR
jgi:YfiR/HmsC-like